MNRNLEVISICDEIVLNNCFWSFMRVCAKYKMMMCGHCIVYFNSRCGLLYYFCLPIRYLITYVCYSGSIYQYECLYSSCQLLSNESVFVGSLRLLDLGRDPVHLIDFLNMLLCR